MEVFGLIFVVAAAAALAVIPAGLVYGLVKLWRSERHLDHKIPVADRAGLATWGVSVAALLFYVFMIPKVEPLSNEVALSFAGAPVEDFRVLQAQTRSNGAFTSLFILAVGNEQLAQPKKPLAM